MPLLPSPNVESVLQTHYLLQLRTIWMDCGRVGHTCNGIYHADQLQFRTSNGKFHVVIVHVSLLCCGIVGHERNLCVALLFLLDDLTLLDLLLASN